MGLIFCVLGVRVGGSRLGVANNGDKGDIKGGEEKLRRRGAKETKTNVSKGDGNTS